MKNVLIAGASGFLGKNTLLKIPSDWKVTAVYHTSMDFPEFVREKCGRNVTASPCDFTDFSSIKQFTAKHGQEFDACIYFAANSNPWISMSDPIIDFKKGPQSLVNFLTHFKMKRMIFFSSGAVYYGLKGDVDPDSKVDPVLPYAVSKLSSELYVKALHQYKQNPEEYVIVRFFDAYGPYEKPRRIFTKLIQELYLKKSNRFQIFGDGKNWIDSMYSEDASEGIIAMAESPQKNVTVDFCTGKIMTIDELILTTGEVFGIKNLEIIHSGQPAEYILFRAGPDRMKKIFNIMPKTPVREGIMKFAKFMENAARKAAAW